MKKALFFISANIFFTLFSFAQITISQSNMPSIGLIAIESVDTVFSGVTPGNSGVSQNWDFSSLVTHTIDTTSFVNPTTLAGSSSFPTANIGASSSQGQNFFVDGNSTQYDILGIHGDFGSFAGIVTIKLNPFKRLISFPATYGNSYSGNYTYEITIPFNNPPMDSARMSAVVAYNYNIDGWGTITTPAFSNVPCLRQKVTEINTTTMEVHVAVLGWQPYGSPTTDTTITYTWWSDTHDYSLAEIETDASGIVSAAKYLGATITDIKEISNITNEIKVFPNPASNQLNFKMLDYNNNVYIYTAEGKFISKSLLSSDKNQINISDLENGLYFYKRVDLNGQIIEKGKFEILK